MSARGRRAGRSASLSNHHKERGREFDQRTRQQETKPAASGDAEWPGARY